jgi:hypothetical protein
MTENYYEKALDAARTELTELLRQNEEIEKRIARLRQTIASLSALREESEVAEDIDDQVRIPGAVDAFARDIARTRDMVYGRTIGFSDAVREVLKAGGGYMTPAQVKDGLIRMGIDLEAKYSNPLAVIHTTLKRWEASGEVSVAQIGDKTSYKLAPKRRGLVAPRLSPPEEEKGKIRAPLPTPRINIPTAKTEETDNSRVLRPRIQVPPPLRPEEKGKPLSPLVREGLRRVIEKTDEEKKK